MQKDQQHSLTNVHACLSELKPAEVEKEQLAEDFKDDQETVNLGKVQVKWDQFIKMKKRKFTDDYNIISEIGRGGFGCVYKVSVKTNNIGRAAKKIQKSKLKEDEHESLLE